MQQILTKKNKALLSELVRTDFKLRYQGSVLGYAWSLMRPLFMFAILYVVFVKFLRIGDAVPNYPIYLLLGIVLWSFFSEMTSQSLGAIVGRGDLIRKIRIPRWMIIASTSISASINLGINLAVVFLFGIFSGLEISASSLLLPLIILEIYLFALGLSLLLSALFVRYRDVSHIWEVFLQAGFYVTPILYPLSIITNQSVQKILLLNPLAQAIQDARSVIVTSESITLSSIFEGAPAHAIPVLVVALVLAAGAAYFRSQAKSFAENL